MRANGRSTSIPAGGAHDTDTASGQSTAKGGSTASHQAAQAGRRIHGRKKCQALQELSDEQLNEARISWRAQWRPDMDKGIAELIEDLV